MRLINTITADPNQNFLVVLDDGTKIGMALRYSANQKGGFYSVTYGAFSDANRRMVNSPNMLRQFRGIIPFGLACTVSDGYEPVFIQDFVSGRVQLFVLTQAEVLEVEDIITQ